MGKQLRKGRHGTAATANAATKQTCGLNWVLKTGILKQAARADIVRSVPGAALMQGSLASPTRSATLQLPSASRPTMTMTRSIGSAALGGGCSPLLPTVQAEKYSAARTDSDAGQAKVQRNATFSIKRFPCDPPFRNPNERNLREGQTASLKSQSAGSAEASSSSSSNPLKNAASPMHRSTNEDSMEQDLLSLKSQLQQAMETVDNALNRYQQWKLGIPL